MQKILYFKFFHFIYFLQFLGPKASLKNQNIKGLKKTLLLLLLQLQLQQQQLKKRTSMNDTDKFIKFLVLYIKDVATASICRYNKRSIGLFFENIFIAKNTFECFYFYLKKKTIENILEFVN